MKTALLDTNVLLAWMRETPEAVAAIGDLRKRTDISRLATSFICKGEMWTLAKSNGWSGARRDRLRGLLGSLPTLGIDGPGVVDA